MKESIIKRKAPDTGIPTNPMTTTTVPFQVQIPNFEGDGIAERVEINVEVHVDPDTGEEVLTQESLALIERTQARHMGLMLPEEIKELRQRLDLTQHEISSLLQVGEKTYTRWENGRSRPSRSMNLLLHALRDGCINVNYLRLRQNPELKTEWFSTIFEPRDHFTGIGPCNLRWNDDLRIELANKYHNGFRHSDAIMTSGSGKQWHAIFIADQMKERSSITVKIRENPPGSDQSSGFRIGLGRQGRNPDPASIGPDDEPCG